MLNLQPGVHLQEIEFAVIIGEELDRAGAGVADRARGQPGRVEELGPHTGCAFYQGRRCFFDDLLMAALNGAFPFPDGPYGAVGVRKHLDLDVVTGGQVALAEHGRVPECGLCFAPGGGDFIRQGGQFADHSHAATATSRGGFHEDRQLRLSDRVGIEFVEHRHTRGGHELLSLDFGAHRPHRIHRRPDPDQPRVLYGGGEVSVLRKESVTGVNGVGAGGTGRRDDGLGVEIVADLRQPHAGVGVADVGRGGVRIGVDRDGAQTQPAAAGEHPAGDLTAVGYQNSIDSHQHHIRKTPKLDVPLIGPVAMADKHIPSTVRVSRGSITPSS